MRDAAEESERSRLIFRLIEEEKLNFGREDSFKMSERRLLANRFLVGVRTTDISEETVLRVCSRMAMPESYRPIVRQHFSDANVVLFGLEESPRGGVYTLYLEFWDKLRKEIRKSHATDPALLNLGFKWGTADNTECSIARYTCFPLLTVAGIFRRISDIYRDHCDRTSYEIAVSLISMAAARNSKASFIYLEVSEDNNPRKSFDINLYKAELQLSDIHPLLLDMSRHFSIPHAEFDQLYDRISSRTLGHLSGGLDRGGNDFLTTYYEIEAL